MIATLRSHRDLRVYQHGFLLARQVFEMSKEFPREERYSLTDQYRRASRSVCANLAEAFRKRRYRKMFIAKLSDVEAEAAECQVWSEFALSCGYIEQGVYAQMIDGYEKLIAQVILMIENPEKWVPR